MVTGGGVSALTSVRTALDVSASLIRRQHQIEESIHLPKASKMYPRCYQMLPVYKFEKGLNLGRADCSSTVLDQWTSYEYQRYQSVSINLNARSVRLTLYC